MSLSEEERIARQINKVYQQEFKHYRNKLIEQDIRMEALEDHLGVRLSKREVLTDHGPEIRYIYRRRLNAPLHNRQSRKRSGRRPG